MLSAPEVAECVQEILKNNRQLCSSIEERHIKLIVNTIAEKGKCARYLQILNCLVLVDGKPHKENQTLVLKSLMDRERDVIVLFKDSNGIKERYF